MKRPRLNSKIQFDLNQKLLELSKQGPYDQKTALEMVDLIKKGVQLGWINPQSIKMTHFENWNRLFPASWYLFQDSETCGSVILSDDKKQNFLDFFLSQCPQAQAQKAWLEHFIAQSWHHEALFMCFVRLKETHRTLPSVKNLLKNTFWKEKIIRPDFEIYKEFKKTFYRFLFSEKENRPALLDSCSSIQLKRWTQMGEDFAVLASLNNSQLNRVCCFDVAHHLISIHRQRQHLDETLPVVQKKKVSSRL